MKKKKKSAAFEEPAGRGKITGNKRKSISARSENGETPEDDGGAYRPGMPVMIKVDLETTFEKALMWTILISVFVAASILIKSYEYYNARELMIYFPIPVGLSVLAFYCRRNTDNYYLIDALRRKIYFISTFFGKEFVSLFARSEDILAFGVGGEKCSGKNSSWIEYRLVAVDKQGIITALSDAKVSGRAKFNEKAEEYARIMGCDFFKCPNKSRLLTRITPEGSHEIYFEEIKDADQ